MTNDPNRFHEISWRRRLSPAEQAELQAWLEANPASREEWEAEMALASVMDGWAEPLVPSNFTARVLQAIEHETAESVQVGPSWWSRLTHRTGWVLSGSLAALLVLTSVLLQNHHLQKQHELAKQELLKSVILVSAVQVLPNTEVLTSFDAIRALSTAPPPDEQLLALLQ